MLRRIIKIDENRCRSRPTAPHMPMQVFKKSVNWGLHFPLLSVILFFVVET